MIKRIKDPEEFSKVLDDIHILFKEDDDENAHQLVKHDKESIKKRFSNRRILTWSFFVWANKTEGKYDAIICFVNENVKFGENIFSEYLWLSKNPKFGYKLLKEAVSFARKNKFNYITLGNVEKSPYRERNEKFFKKLGFLKDSTLFISKL